jgi:hypothetical protein
MSEYPKNWKTIAKRIKEAAGWKCERCHHANTVEGAYVLTVHHLTGDKSNCEDWNLAALCQRCHLKIQGRVKMEQLFFATILDVSEWFKPHLEGYLKSLISAAPGEAHVNNGAQTTPVPVEQCTRGGARRD